MRGKVKPEGTLDTMKEDDTVAGGPSLLNGSKARPPSQARGVSRFLRVAVSFMPGAASRSVGPIQA